MSIPVGATHVNPETNCFYKLCRDTWYQVLDDGGMRPSQSLYNGQTNAIDLVALPAVKQWSGPQDGLPPVGTVCEWKEKTGFHWVKATVLFISDSSVVLQRMDGFEWQMMTARTVFRQFKTQDQLAADLRETAIADMAKVLPGANYECYSFNDDGSVNPYQRVRMILELLVDAGFKRPSKSGQDIEEGISDLRHHIAHANFRRSPNSGDDELAKQLYGAGFRREVV